MRADGQQQWEIWREMNDLKDYKDKNQQDMVMNLDLKDDQEVSVSDDSQAE